MAEDSIPDYGENVFVENAQPEYKKHRRPMQLDLGEFGSQRHYSPSDNVEIQSLAYRPRHYSSQEKLLYSDDLTQEAGLLDDWEPEADQTDHVIRVRDDEELEREEEMPSDNSAHQDEASRATSHETGIAPTLIGEETSHAFFCYCAEDEEWAYNVMRKLESSAYGFQCDNHEHQLEPSRARMDKIVNALCTAKKIVLVLSQDFIQSQWCTYENLKSLKTHFTNTKKVIPVLLADLDLPEFLQDVPCINAIARNFWQKFIAALQLESHRGGAECSAEFNIPALYNGVQLGKVYSTTDCCCKARFDTIYCPDELARKGVVIPQQDYTTAVSTILEGPKMRWYTLWYNRIFSMAMSLFLTVLILLGLVGNLSNFNSSNSRGSLHVGWALLIGIVLSILVVILLHVIAHFETIKLNVHIENHLARANISLCRHSVLVGMTDGFITCNNRAILHFIYYDLAECRKTMVSFLAEQRNLQRGFNKDVTVTIDLGLQAPEAAPVPEQDDTSRLTFDTRHRVLSPETLVADTEPASLQEEAELYLLQSSPSYVYRLVTNRLDKASRRLHSKHAMCLCQYAQKNIFKAEV